MGFISAFRGSSVAGGMGSESGSENMRGVMEMVQGATGTGENQVSLVAHSFRNTADSND